MHTAASPLMTDHYEFTMLDAALQDGTAHRPCVFEMFARNLPAGRRYGVFAGLGRLIAALDDFTFSDDTLAFLDNRHIVSPATLRWLDSYEFTGDLVAYREGELYFPQSPVLTVAAPFGQAILLETLALSIVNHDSAIASAAARMVAAAAGRRLVEFGSRRTHESAAIAAARAAYLCGFDATSNLAAGQRYGIPTSGTTAHAFTMVHETEHDAFASQWQCNAQATFLVDTYDIKDAIATVVALAAEHDSVPYAIRIDSGDLASGAQFARKQLDDAGCHATQIVLSGDLDEFRIERLRDAPADAFGVGTSLVTGSGHPTAEFVYKLVAVAPSAAGEMRGVAKGGGHKATTAGRKAAWRHLDGRAGAELLQPWPPTQRGPGRRLQHTVIADGQLVAAPQLQADRAFHTGVIDELDAEHREVGPGAPAIPTEFQATAPRT